MSPKHYQSTLPKPNLRQDAMWKLEEEVQEIAYFLRHLPDTPGLQPRGKNYADLLQAGFARLGVLSEPNPSSRKNEKAPLPSPPKLLEKRETSNDASQRQDERQGKAVPSGVLSPAPGPETEVSGVRSAGVGTDVGESSSGPRSENQAPNREGGRIVRCFDCIGYIPTRAAICATCGGTRKVRIGLGPGIIGQVGR